MGEKEFEAIYRECFDPVYRYALALTRDEHSAEELTQEAFFKAMQSIEHFRGDCSLRTWLCAIVKNAFLSEKRRKPALSLDEVPEYADGDSDPESLTLQSAERVRILRAVHALPEPYREVFSLRVFGQLHFREIGELFGKTENWACVVYHRARGKLRQEWEGS